MQAEGRKTSTGAFADTEDSPVVEAVRFIRKAFPTLLVMCDVCMCAYTDHGHW